ncbi:hypothetical protein J5N97_012745 [Dioscorea zingiberensis]|uniref:Protein TIC 40, chloroplastic n=1 Tax=Dioscorea zingiberensis TaxID=325984 RepID=A0A9D5CPH7_9LILI|nr:hypothetical protein J5N97_012745 [Dioscorea zingiberensis]
MRFCRGSPLFWIGVGVGLTVLFTTVASKLKRYAMQQVVKTMIGQSATSNGGFSNAPGFPGSQFPFPPTPPSAPRTSSPTPVSSQSVVTVDVPPMKVESTSSTKLNDEIGTHQEPKSYAFVDVSPEEAQKETFENYRATIQDSTTVEVSSNGAAIGESKTASTDESRQPASTLSVEALEKMMEDPTVQQMVYPYLPEEMRNPTTFKWMLQNPQYRQQLQDMLNNMGGGSEWDKRMVDSLKNFDLSSPEVKQQFDQIGLTPEEVISKIMANPDIAMAFQNPKVQAAIMECSQNPLSIAKYQNDKEVMDVFNKISELFPGMTGSP